MTAIGSIKLVATLCLMAMVGNAAADTYRWVDPGGVVNYSERKPHGVDAELIGQTTKSSKRPSARASSPASPASTQAVAATPNGGDPQSNLSDEQARMKAELEQAEAARQEQITKVRQDNCERSRRVLDNLSSKGRIRVRGDNGEERAMDEVERQQRITEAQQGIVANCQAS